MITIILRKNETGIMPPAESDYLISRVNKIEIVAVAALPFDKDAGTIS